MNNLDIYLNSLVEKKLSAGVSALLFKDGREAYFGSAGYADMAEKKPFERNTIFRVYSMTKTVTSAAVMTLVEKGVFGLDTPLSEFIPEYSKAAVCECEGGQTKIVPAKREITVFHLLTMTSGMSYGDLGRDAASDVCAEGMAKIFRALRKEELAGGNVDALRFARKMAECPLCFHPGEKWRYGVSTDILGALIIAATGMTLGEYFRREIFGPLGMDETFFTLPEDMKDRAAKVYLATKNGLREKKRPIVAEMGGLPSFQSGGAGLYSTVDDFAVFGNMLLCGGEFRGVRILKAETVREMTRNHLTPQQAAAYDWVSERGFGHGLTMRVMLRPDESDYDERPGAFGWNGAAGTSLRMDPARGTTLVFGSQRMPSDHILFLPQLTREVTEFLKNFD